MWIKPPPMCITKPSNHIANRIEIIVYSIVDSFSVGSCLPLMWPETQVLEVVVPISHAWSFSIACFDRLLDWKVRCRHRLTTLQAHLKPANFSKRFSLHFHPARRQLRSIQAVKHPSRWRRYILIPDVILRDRVTKCKLLATRLRLLPLQRL